MIASPPVAAAVVSAVHVTVAELPETDAVGVPTAAGTLLVVIVMYPPV
jgi:hypothetical protein